jgi:YD repeat-containing protein
MRQTDLSIAEAGYEIPLTRTYAANERTSRNPSHAFGMNANHPFDIAPIGTRNPYTYQLIVLEDGDFLYFPRVSKGTSFANAIYRQSEIGNSFYAAVQRWDGNGWKTELRDGSTLHFPESYNAGSLARGAATEMTDAAGRKIELIRDRKRNLQEIRGPSGASIKLVYDDQDRIVGASDGHGQWTKYTYNSLGFLRDVVRSDGTGRNYFYEDGLLTIVRDQQNRLLVQNSYQGNWLSQQKFGNGETFQYEYDLSSNKKYAKRVAVKLSNGSVKIIEIGDCVSEVYKRMP